MDEEEIVAVLEARIPDADATVQVADQHGENKHYAIDVSSPEFEGKSLIDQHQTVHDALGDHLTRDIHAIEVTTTSPAESGRADDG